MKKLVSLILCVALVFSFAAPALAANTIDVEPQAISLTAAQQDIYARYEATTAGTAYADISLTKQALAGLCTQISTTTVNGKNYTDCLPSVALQNLLPYCARIQYVTVTDAFLYICYTASDNKTIILCYSDEGLDHMALSGSEKDSVLLIENSTLKTYLPNVETLQLTEEQKRKINLLANEGKYEAIDEIDGIHVSQTEAGLLIEPEIITSVSASTLSNKELLYEALQNDFPQYSKQTKFTESRYCSALSKNVSITVKEDRNTYITKDGAVWRKFEEDAQLSIISTFLDLPITETAMILTTIGVTISAIETIQNAVNVYKSAKYSYHSARYGYALDTTTYNNRYVRVVEYHATGEFAGGYDTNGIFRWIISETPTTERYSYSQISQTTISNYNADVTINGACTLYYPD